MTVILGYNAFHADSAACLVVDGKLVGAVAEERLGDRQKHSPAFPANAIRHLLADAGLRLRDVTRAAGAVVEHLSRNRRTRSMIDQLAEVCHEDPASVEFETVGVEHHLCHIPS